MCSWIWGSIVLAGTVGQAEEVFWPGQRPSPSETQRQGAASPQQAGTSRLLPPLAAGGPFIHLALQDAASTSRNVPEENLRENAGSNTALVSPDRQNPAKDPQTDVGGLSQSGPSGEKGTSHESGDLRSEPIRLRPSTDSRPLSAVSHRAFSPAASTLTVLSSLAIVLGVFLLLVWAIRRAMPRGSQLLPTDVVEVLGRAPLLGRQQMYLLRCGPKLLLLSVTPEGAETLTEIEHPDEVARIIALCRQGQPGSIPGAFRHILDQMARSKSDQGSFRRSGMSPDESVEQRESLQEESARV